jgi:hypothetical protein
MEHPLIHNLDDLSLEQLQERINDITKKLSWATRHSPALAGQLGMVLESYRNKYQEKQQKLWNDSKNKGSDYSDRIDVS